MLKRLAFFFALSPLSVLAQVQFDIVSVPVCWNDSSLVKYAYVTTSGAYLDLGYFSPSGNPVTVSGGTLKTGFCFDQTFSIDSTANRTFTITLGDQTVSWVDSVGAGSGGGITALRLGELTDVDTTGEATGSIIMYDATSGNWEAQPNSIDNLTDGYYDINLNLFLGKNPSYIVPGSSSARFNVGYGYFALDSIGTGYDNTAIGTSAMYSSKRGSYRNTALGRAALGGATHSLGFRNNYHENGVAIGAFSAANDTLFFESITIGGEAGFGDHMTGKIRSLFIGNKTIPLDTLSVDQIVIGAYAIPKGDSTVVIGRNFYKGTYLHGNLNLNNYGLGNKEATDLTKTRSAYIAAFATDGTLLELDTTGLYASGATTLNSLTDVTLTNPQINDVLKYNGTAWVNDTLTISGGGGVLSVTANNGLTNTGTASQPVIELGGTLSKATTTISANFKNLVINRPLNFEVDSVYLARIGTQDGLSTSSKLQIGAAANSWQSVNNDDDLTNRIELYSSLPTQGAKISSYQNSNNGIFTQIQLLPQEMKVVTPGVNSGTATAGQVLKLVNASTGEVEFASDSTGSATLSSLTDVQLATPTNGQALKYDGTKWVNGSDLVNDADADPTNELQDLSLTGNTLSLSGDATTVDLSGYLDDQTVSLTGAGITVISGTYPNFTITTTEVDGSTTNEIQTLSLDGNTLSISGGNSVNLSGLGGSGIDLTDLSVTVAAAGSANLSYNNTNGVFTYTPPDLTGYLTSEVDGSVSNEGVLSASALVSGSIARLTSNTNGGSNVDFSAGTGIAVGSSGGNTISITNTLPEATTASNGLTEQGNDIKLGGTLSESTTIAMAGNDMTFTGTSGSDMLIDLAGSTTINSTNASGYNSSLILDGTSPRLLADAKTTEPLNMIELMGGRSGVKEMTLSSQVSNDNTTYTAMYFNPTRVSLKTPNVVDLTAQNGQFLQLVDRLTGEVEFASALSAEVDGSVSNEGALSPGTGVAGSSVFIQSNTSGSSPVTISVGNGLDIAASGQTIFLNPEAFPIENGTSGAISWGGAPQRIHVLDFGANTSITLSFTNVAIGGIYTLRVTGNSGTDTLIWPASAKYEDGTSAGTVTLQNGGQMFTFYWDGTNYWVK